MMTSDISKLRAALRAVSRETKKPDAVIVNKALKDVAFRAASFTKKTTPAKIRAELNPQLLARMAAAHLKATKGKFTKAEQRATMQRIRKRRLKGVGGVRAGWFPAIVALGGKIRGAKANPGGSARKGFAKKAGGFRLAGHIRNAVVTTQFARRTTTGAGDIRFAAAALSQAVRFVTRDRAAYLERKRAVGQVLHKHSDK